MDKQTQSGCLLGCVSSVIFSFVFFCGLIALFGFLFKSCSSMYQNSMHEAFAENEDAGVDDKPAFSEVWSCGTGAEDATKIIRIPVTGIILLSDESSMWGKPSDASVALRAIHRATVDDDVRGLYLEIDSGGGGVTASDIIYNAVKEFKAAKEGRFVVASFGDVAASGAYYIALAADYIIAHPTTITGSIGVIMETFNVAELATKIGVKDVTIKSGANKDLLNPLVLENPEHRAIVQKIINASYDRFVSLVAENRKLPKDIVLPLADGRIFSAQDALANRLIDGIGYHADVMEKIADYVGSNNFRVYRYKPEFNFMDVFSSSLLFESATSVQRRLENATSETRRMYR